MTPDTPRNGHCISEVTLRHFAGMFSKVSTMEEFKLPIDFSISTLSTPKKWKNCCYSYSFTYLFHARISFTFSYSVVYRITMRIIQHIKVVTNTHSLHGLLEKVNKSFAQLLNIWYHFVVIYKSNFVYICSFIR